MELIAAHDKDFENIALRNDPVYAGIESILDLLVKFISDRGLIIYGGLAIDYALRLVGDKLYPDDLLQIDYDFFSPDHIEHSYDLADKFYEIVRSTYGEEAAEGVRAIGALHFETMRVDIRDNHFLADITYLPRAIFPHMPTLEYRGMKIVHPDIQRIDIHSSLSFPYDFPPTEVIFARWRKDITRFHMLAKHYPLVDAAAVNARTVSTHSKRTHNVASTVDASMDISTDVAPTVSTVNVSGASASMDVSMSASVGTVKVGEDVKKYVLAGFSAYGIMYRNVLKSCGSVPKDIIKPSGGGDLLYGDTLEIVHFNPPKCAAEMNLAHVQRFRRFINMIPETLTGVAKFGKVKIDSTEGRLISYVSATVDGKTYRLACVQYLLKQFLAEYHRANMQGADGRVYLEHYISTMRLMEYEHGCIPSTEKPITRLSVVTYGSDNISTSKEISIRRVLADIGEATPDYLPSNYYPARRKGDRPKYDITRNEIFQESGETRE